MAVNHPDRVQTLIVGAAPPATGSSASFLQNMLSQSPEERTDLMVEAVLSPKARTDRELTATVCGHLSMTYSVPGSHRMEALRNHGLDEELLMSDFVLTHPPPA